MALKSTVFLTGMVALLLGVSALAADAQAGDAGQSMLAYEAERLRLVDGEGNPIGPAALGYDSSDLTAANGASFHVVYGGEPNARLGLEEIVTTLDVSKLTSRWNTIHEAVKKQEAKAIAALAGGGGLGLTAIISSLVIGSVDKARYSNGAQPDGLGSSETTKPPMEEVYVGAAIVALSSICSVSLLLSGGGMHARAARVKKLMADNDVAYLRDRRTMWEEVQTFNSDLRQQLDLPDDVRMDAK